MRCPVCAEVDLVMAERQGVEIDYCPKCRGVWLDRGELDKIIERSSVEQPREAVVARPEYPAERPREYERDHRRDDHDHDKDHGYGHDRDHGYEHGKPYKKKTLLGTIFDF